MSMVPAITPGPRVLNLRDFAVGGVKPRPWGPFNLPPDVVQIDRGTPWGNPYPLADSTEAARRKSLADFEWYATDRLQREPDWLDPLKGKRLACWCAPKRCHGDWIVARLEERGW